MLCQLQLAYDLRLFLQALSAQRRLAERTLSSLGLTEEGVLVQDVHRADGHNVGVPTGDSVIHASDTLIIDGPKERIIELDTPAWDYRRIGSPYGGQGEDVSGQRTAAERLGFNYGLPDACATTTSCTNRNLSITAAESTNG